MKTIMHAVLVFATVSVGASNASAAEWTSSRLRVALEARGVITTRTLEPIISNRGLVGLSRITVRSKASAALEGVYLFFPGASAPGIRYIDADELPIVIAALAEFKLAAEGWVAAPPQKGVSMAVTTTEGVTFELQGTAGNPASILTVHVADELMPQGRYSVPLINPPQENRSQAFADGIERLRAGLAAVTDGPP